jgi:hypothetical protein
MMPKLDNRTLGLIVLALLLVLLLLNPGTLVSTISVVQSVAFTVLAVVATLYLWKRL